MIEVNTGISIKKVKVEKDQRIAKIEEDKEKNKNKSLLFILQDLDYNRKSLVKPGNINTTHHIGVNKRFNLCDYIIFKLIIIPKLFFSLFN